MFGRLAQKHKSICLLSTQNSNLKGCLFVLPMKSMHIDTRGLLDVQEKFKQFHNSIETHNPKICISSWNKKRWKAYRAKMLFNKLNSKKTAYNWIVFSFWQILSFFNKEIGIFLFSIRVNSIILLIFCNNLTWKFLQVTHFIQLGSFNNANYATATSIAPCLGASSNYEMPWIKIFKWNTWVKFNEFLEKLLWDPKKLHIFPSPSNISK